MTKTFREILAERDDEFTYYVRSTANIHDPEIFERIRLAWLPYVIKSFETDAYKPLSRDNKMFPEQPNSPTFTIKVVTGLPIPKKHIETMALDARIHISHLRIDPDGDLELVNEPNEVASAEAQNLVGHKRIGEFIRELQADRKKREEMSSSREVYESFCTTHRGLEDVLKKPLRKGYYMVEAYREDGKTYLRAEGPFEVRPEDRNYHDRIRAKNPQVIAEGKTGSMYGVQILIEGVETK